MSNEVEFYGVKDGKEVFLGKHAMPPSMKAREIMRGYGYGSFDDDMSEDSIIMGMMEDMVAYCQEYYQPMKVESNDS